MTNQQQGSGHTQDPEPLEAAYAAVPSIGAGRRWYDLPYRALDRLLRSRAGRRLPAPVRRVLSGVLTQLSVFNRHDRNRACSREDPMHNLIVGPGLRATLPDLWLVDYFPPSELAALERALRRRGWDALRTRHGMGEGNAELLRVARHERGWRWWRIGTATNREVPSWNPEARRAKLPAEFSQIDLVGMTIGPALTVVVAHVRLTESGRQSVNAVWNGPHPPRLTRRGRRLQTQDGLWSGFARTQRARRRVHDLARDWLRQECPGIFASSGADQPLMDLLLLDGDDPTDADSRPDSRARRDALRALGILDDPYRVSSGELPGLLVEQVDSRLAAGLPGTATWTLWGSLAEAGQHATGDGFRREPLVAVGTRHDDAAREVVVRLGLLELAALKRRQAARARDSARSQYGRVRRRRTLQLREQFLRESLDTATLMRDLRAYAADASRRDAPLRRSLHPRLAGTEPPWPADRADVDADIAEALREAADDLVAFDADYRSIMSTAATLGMAATALLTQRIALGIALLSLDSRFHLAG